MLGGFGRVSDSLGRVMRVLGDLGEVLGRSGVRFEDFGGDFKCSGHLLLDGRGAMKPVTMANIAPI